MTNRLADLVLPALLPKPIPIGSANGSTLFATHVGSSSFDSRLQVYFVPEFAVKLLSLGSLTTLGYTYASGCDRHLTIHTPAGRLLCICPIQPNNIWFFPTHLMSTDKILNNSNVKVPNVSFQFLTPLNPIHFSKEQVKRATQARDLHHFLSHPSDDALRTTIDQGLLSRHTNLTSADVDLMNKFYGSYVACTSGKLHYQDVHVTSTSKYFPHLLSMGTLKLSPSSMTTAATSLY